MPETEREMLARLKVIAEPAGVWCEITPEDSAALCHALVLIERYRKALIEARDTLGPATAENLYVPAAKTFRIIRAALHPDPTPTETGVTDTERLDRLERALIAGAEVITDNQNLTYIFLQMEDDHGDYLWISRGDGDLRAAIDGMPAKTEAKL